MNYRYATFRKHIQQQEKFDPVHDLIGRFARTPSSGTPASKATQAQYQKLASKEYATFARRRGMDVKAYTQAVDKKATSLLKDAQPWIAARPEALESILHEGQFRASTEARFGEDADYQALRTGIEQQYFGTAPEATERPIYGYASAHPDGDMTNAGGINKVAMYGSVSIKLKPVMREQATWTGDDSYSAYGTLLPTKLTAPDHRSFRADEDPLLYENLPDVPNYPELQFHGGVQRTAIDEVVFTNASDLTETLQSALERRNIPYRIVGQKKAEKYNHDHSSVNGQFISTDDGDGGVNADVMASMPAHIAKALSDKGAIKDNGDGSFRAQVNGKAYHIVPVGSQTVAFSQVGASRIAKVLGAGDLIPDVHAGKMGDTPVVMAEDTGGDKLMSADDAKDAMSTLPPDKLTKATMLEYLLGMKQDQPGHYLLDGKTGKINLTQLSSALVKHDAMVKIHSFLMKVIGNSRLHESIDHGILGKFLSQEKKALLLSDKFAASPEAKLGLQGRFAILHQLASMKHPTWEDFFAMTAHPDSTSGGKPPELVSETTTHVRTGSHADKVETALKPGEHGKPPRKKPGHRTTAHKKEMDFSLYLPEKVVLIEVLEEKYNHAHSAENGEFTSLEGGHQKTEAKYANPEDIPLVQEYMKTGNGPRENGEGDPVLKALYAAQGFDGLPHLVEDSQLAEHIQNGEAELFRGVEGMHYAKAYQTGDYFAGRGVYGNGTYTAMTTEGTSEETSAQHCASGYGDNVLHLSVLPNTTAITSGRLLKEFSTYTKDIQDKASAAFDQKNYEQGRQYERLLQLIDEPGRFATAKGYDAIYVDRSTVKSSRGKLSDFLVILNRTATRVGKTVLDGKEL